MFTDPRYQEVAQMIRTGNKANARQLIKLMLRDNPNNADAWYLAAGVSDGEQQRMEALRRALAIDPNHARARAALGEMRNAVVEEEESESVATRKEESTVHFVLRVLLGIGALLVGAYFGYLAFDNMTRGSVFTVDIGDVVLALRAIFYLIAAVAVLFFAGALLKNPNA